MALAIPASLLVPVPIGLPGFGWTWRPVLLWIVDALANHEHLQEKVVPAVAALLIVPVLIIGTVYWLLGRAVFTQVKSRAARMALAGALLFGPVVISLAPVVGDSGNQRGFRSVWDTIEAENEQRRIRNEDRNRRNRMYALEFRTGTLKNQRRYREAEVCFRSLLVLRKRELASIDTEGAARDGAAERAANVLHEIAECAIADGRPADAEPMAREACTLLEERRHHPLDNQYFLTMRTLAKTLQTQGKHAELENVVRKALEIEQRKPEAFRASAQKRRYSVWPSPFLQLRAMSLRDRKMFAEARQVARQALAALQLSSRDSAEMFDTLADIHAGLGNAKQAEACRTRGEAIRMKTDRSTERNRPDQMPGAGMPQQGTASTVVARDEFDGELDLDWEVLEPDPSHVSLITRPGSLTITTQDGGFFRYDKGARNIYLIANPILEDRDFTLTTRIVSFQPNTAHHQAGLLCWDDEDNYIKAVCIWGGKAGRSNLSLLCETEAYPWFWNVDAGMNSPDVWLRLTRHANRYTFSTSTDGKSYRTLGRMSWGAGLPKMIGLVAKNAQPPRGSTGSAVPEIEASFEFFELRAAAETPDPDQRPEGTGS